MKLRTLLMVALALMGCIVASTASQVTFQVDMSFQIDNRGWDPTTNRVEVRGSFNNWQGGPAWTLAKSPTNLQTYTGAFTIPGTPGTPVEYRYWRSPDQLEWIPNRTFTLEAGPEILGPVLFSDDRGEQPVTGDVTFRVNMITQIAAGNFDPIRGDVLVARGEFNDWGTDFTLSPEPDNTNIYSGAASITRAPGSAVQYKFSMQRGLTGRPEVSENNQGTPSGNREFVFTGEEQTLPLVYFNNISGIPIKAIIQFAVDMNVQIAAGKFSPDSHEVYIRANMGVGFGDPPTGDGIRLEEDFSRPGVYTNAFKADNLITEQNFEFKFVIWNFVTSTATPEDGPNKIIVFNGTEPVVAGYHTITYGPNLFNNVALADLLTEDTLVTFRVNMTNAAFNPNTQGVWINGSFLPGGWATWGVTAEDRHLLDDGLSNGDAVAGDRIYTLQYLLPRGSYSRIEYKYGINAADNEASVGTNHVRYVRGKGTYVLPVDQFGVMASEPIFGGLTASPGAAGHILLNWLGRPGVRLQKLDALGSATGVDVANTDGKNFYDYAINSSAVFFRLSAAAPTFGDLTAAAGAPGHIIMSWQGLPGVRLQKLDALGTSTGVDVASTDGRNSYDYTINTNVAAFFRLIRR